MVRVANTVEKTVTAVAANVVTVAAALSTEILPDLTKTTAIASDEYAGRYIFNDTGAVLYYAFGQDCDNLKSYHGKIADQQQLDCSNHGNRVCVYSVAGGKVAPTILRRVDLDPGVGNILTDKVPH